ncbi:MAG: ferrous iron transport protein A [Selenomonadales bacterium]|nr:ferrous iron transport protein A [Selenomonadales bacterium]
MNMSDLRRGDTAVVRKIIDELVRAQAIRFGIAEGALFAVEEVLPHGPVIVRRGTMRYAIGRNLARQIEVERTAAKAKKHA